MTTFRETMARRFDERDFAAPVRLEPSALAAPVVGLELAVVSTRSGFDALEADWNGLFERAGRSEQLFQAFNWNWHWANHFLKNGRSAASLAIVTGRLDGRLVMVWPLVMERAVGLRVLAWMGEPVSQYGDVLVEAGPERMAMLRAAWGFILATLKPDLARLNKTRIDSAIAPLLAERGAISTQQLDAPYLDLASAPTFAAYEERYTVKARKNRRRLARRLEEQGAVQFQQFHEGREAGAIVRQAIAIKRLWLQQKGLVSPALADGRTMAFFEAAAGDTVRPTGIRVSALMCGETLTAAEIAFAQGQRLAIHLMVYDLDYEKRAAGVLLLERNLAVSLAAGVETYDLLAPGDGYKKEWADGTVRVDDYAVPVTIGGRAYVRGYLAYLRPKLKAAVGRIPLATRQAVSGRIARLVLTLGGAK